MDRRTAGSFWRAEAAGNGAFDRRRNAPGAIQEGYAEMNAVTAGPLTLVLRKNHAAAQWWVLLAASVKFLIPFALLVRLGGSGGWRKTLAMVGIAAIGGPIGIGLVTPQVAQAESQQSPAAAAPLPEFEAVSVKPNKSGGIQGAIHPSRGERLTATNRTLRDLIRWAYSVRDFQISGEPSWVDDERYDVAAKADGNPRFDFLQPSFETMFQSVLSDRFKLALHHETKELPVYTLVVAKNGPKIHPVEEGDCPEVPTPENPCRSLRPTKFGQLTSVKARIAALALTISFITDNTVIDKTGMKGSYSYMLNWMPDLPPPAGGNPAVPVPIFRADFAPAISIALQDQLGLKLESGKGPVDILVIDHVERPSENQ
jgi:uncharacterized protein (TIGR03435 family)